jgi:hypothetical protein
MNNNNESSPNFNLGHLQPQHLEDLRKSGLSDETILAARFTSVVNPATISSILNWRRPATILGACLKIPFLGPDGEPSGYARLKPDRPRRAKGDDRIIKYEAPRGKKNRAYFPVPALAAIRTAGARILVTEGEKKSCAATQAGFPCIGLTGVWSWQKKRKDKEKESRELIEDLARENWQGRPVIITFDSDIADKPEIQWAEFYLAETLSKAGADVKAVRLPPGPNGAKQGLDDFLVSKGDAGPAALEELLASATPVSKPEDRRPLVILGVQEHIPIEQAIQALARCDPGIYQKGNLLVRLNVVKRAPKCPGVKFSNLPTAEIIPEPNLRTRLTKYCNIVSIESDRSVKPSHPPKWLVSGVAASGDYPGIRVLEGVTTSPILLPDGSILQQRGYHADSGLLYLPDQEFPPIPENPSRADALAALAVLLDLVSDFPFASEQVKPGVWMDHRSGWLAALLTVLARHAIGGPCPLFLSDANVRGVGKGLLFHVISTIKTGGDFATAEFTLDHAELAKNITALALQGEPLVLFDNVEGDFGGKTLDRALTSTVWHDRILGKSKKPKLPLSVSWFASANNARIIGDSVRRMLPIRQRSLEEKPEERTQFKYPKLLEHARANRALYVTAALTVLRAYVAAGRPAQNIIEWGSFEEWAHLICGCIVWLGLSDPGLARLEANKDSDHDAQVLGLLLDSWQEEIDPDGEGCTTQRVIDSIKTENKALSKGRAYQDNYPKLREALDAAFDLRVGALPSPKRLGSLLRKFKERVVGGRFFEAVPFSGHRVKWRVRTVKDYLASSPESVNETTSDNHDYSHHDSNDSAAESDPKIVNNCEIHGEFGESEGTSPHCKTFPPSSEEGGNVFEGPTMPSDSPNSPIADVHQADHPYYAKSSSPEGIRPPPGAKLYFEDEQGRNCNQNRSSAVRWTWEGGPAWLDVEEYPPP